MFVMVMGFMVRYQIIMFKLNTVDPTTLSTKLNLYKMRSLLSKALADCRNALGAVQPLMVLNLHKKVESQTQAQPIQEVFENLKKGHLVQKHSRNTKQPHTKLVYLSHDHKWLCWKSIDREDQKKFAISTIVRVVKEGYKINFRSNLNLKNPTCCVIIVSTVRNLQIETASEFEANLLRYQLNRVLKCSQEMSQNYPYHGK